MGNNCWENHTFLRKSRRNTHETRPLMIFAIPHTSHIKKQDKVICEYCGINNSNEHLEVIEANSKAHKMQLKDTQQYRI